MNSKLCKCGHGQDWHMFVKPPACDHDDCKCEKFIVEDEIEELKKELVIARLKELPDNFRIAIG